MPMLKLHKSSSLDKRCNVYCHLLAKEYCAKYSHRRIHLILGTLITRGNYTFKEIWHKESKKSIACDGKLAFFDNYEECIDCTRPYPSKKFVTKKLRPGKIEDGLLMDGSPEMINQRYQGFKSCLFAINSDNFLLQVDLETGKILEEIYVSDNSVKFRRLQWNVVSESFTIFSTKRFQQNNRISPGEVIQLIVMSCMPLDFICKFSIAKQIFGRDVCDATVFLNLLVVMHSSHQVCMYSLERVIQKFSTCQSRLHTSLKNGSVFGIYPSHLSHNIDITEKPDCLFQVRSDSHDVMLTMPPCHYILCPVGKYGAYCCMSFETHQQVKGGYLERDEEEMSVSLHADDSGRIVEMRSKELRVYKLIPESTNHQQKQLVEDFAIRFSETPKSQAPVVSQSGRIIKQIKREGCVDLSEKCVDCMTYSEDLDMIILVFNSMTSGGGRFVGFYDNWTGTLLRKFMLESKTLETLERSLDYNLDTLTHVIKTMDRKFYCHVLKLEAVQDMSDELRSHKKNSQMIGALT